MSDLVEKRTCTACRKSKVKCDKNNPCGRCMRLGLNCVEQVRGRGRPLVSYMLRPPEETNPTESGGPPGYYQQSQGGGSSSSGGGGNGGMPALQEYFNDPHRVQAVNRRKLLIVLRSWGLIAHRNLAKSPAFYQTLYAVGEEFVLNLKDVVNMDHEVYSELCGGNEKQQWSFNPNDLPMYIKALDCEACAVSKRIVMEGESRYFGNEHFSSTFVSGPEADRTPERATGIDVWLSCIDGDDRKEFFHTFLNNLLTTSSPCSETEGIYKCKDKNGKVFLGHVRLRSIFLNAGDLVAYSFFVIPIPPSRYFTPPNTVLHRSHQPTLYHHEINTGHDLLINTMAGPLGASPPSLGGGLLPSTHHPFDPHHNSPAARLRAFAEMNPIGGGFEGRTMSRSMGSMDTPSTAMMPPTSAPSSSPIPSSSTTPAVLSAHSLPPQGIPSLHSRGSIIDTTHALSNHQYAPHHATAPHLHHQQGGSIYHPPSMSYATAPTTSTVSRYEYSTAPPATLGHSTSSSSSSSSGSMITPSSSSSSITKTTAHPSHNHPQQVESFHHHSNDQHQTQAWEGQGQQQQGGPHHHQVASFTSTSTISSSFPTSAAAAAATGPSTVPNLTTNTSTTTQKRPRLVSEADRTEPHLQREVSMDSIDSMVLLDDSPSSHNINSSTIKEDEEERRPSKETRLTTKRESEEQDLAVATALQALHGPPTPKALSREAGSTTISTAATTASGPPQPSSLLPSVQSAPPRISTGSSLGTSSQAGARSPRLPPPPTTLASALLPHPPTSSTTKAEENGGEGADNATQTSNNHNDVMSLSSQSSSFSSIDSSNHHSNHPHPYYPSQHLPSRTTPSSSSAATNINPLRALQDYLHYPYYHRNNSPITTPSSFTHLPTTTTNINCPTTAALQQSGAPFSSPSTTSTTTTAPSSMYSRPAPGKPTAGMVKGLPLPHEPLLKMV